MQLTCINTNLTYICSVKQTLHKLTAFLLLLCITASILPHKLFHYTEVNRLCNNCSTGAESEMCWTSTYNAELKDKKSKHQSNLLELEEVCEFCKFLNAKRHQYATIGYFNIASNVVVQGLSLIGESLSLIHI